MDLIEMAWECRLDLPDSGHSPVQVLVNMVMNPVVPKKMKNF
jgi:hypothetical protein